MGRLTDVRLGDLGAVGNRYRPAALAVAAMLAIIAFVPDGGDGDAAVAPLASTQAPPTTTPPAAVRPPAMDSPAARPATTVAAALVEPPAPRVTPSSAPSAPAPAPAPPASPTRSAAIAAAASQPLRLAGHGWATAQAGTPLASTGVPEGTLPVGTRLAQVDKASFVRLAGDDAVLRLSEHTDGDRGDAAAVQACRIVDGSWSETTAMSFDEAPEWDPDDCAAGIRSEDGTWTFDLGGYPDRDDQRGFALVPGPDAPVDFQVAFLVV